MWTEACHTMEMECFSDSSLYGRKKSGKYHETPMEWLCVIFGRPQINLVRVRFALEAICYRMNAIVNRRYSIVFGTYLARICSLRSTLVYLSFRYRVVSRCRNKEKKYQKAMRACRAGMITEKKLYWQPISNVHSIAILMVNLLYWCCRIPFHSTVSFTVFSHTCGDCTTILQRINHTGVAKCLCPDYTHPRRRMANVDRLFRLISLLFSFFSWRWVYSRSLVPGDCNLPSTSHADSNELSSTEIQMINKSRNVRFAKATAQTFSTKSWLLDDKIKNRFFTSSPVGWHTLFIRRNDCTTSMAN